MSWADDVQHRWGADWDAFAARAQARYADVEQSWDSLYKPRVDKVVSTLVETRDILERLPAKIAAYEDLGGDQVPQYTENLKVLAERYNLLAAGVYRDARTPDGSPALPPTFGVAWFLVAGGLMLAFAGVCFALAAYEYTMSLRDQAAVQDHELDARVEAMRTNKVLAESTYKPPPDPKVDVDGVGVGTFVLVGVLVTGAAAAVWAYSRR